MMSRSALTGLPLSRSAVDRDHLSRSRPALFDELWEEPNTRILPIWKGLALVRDAAGSKKTVLSLLPVADVTSGLIRVYLGRTLVPEASVDACSAIVAQVLTDAAAAELEPDTSRWVNLRVAAQSLSDLDAGLFTEALAITNWHASHTHCPRCGNPTIVEQGGWVRRCISDGTEIFPRTDPAVIVSVLDRAGRILLGSNAMWENNRYSLLAGFVEPGESFEAAVAREIHEEAGVRVENPEYLGSQPWPFPASVMVGFTAQLAQDQDPEELMPDGEEILALRWFSRQELWEERERVLLPGGSSIARAIVEDWYGGPLDAPPSREETARHLE
jgi:NAD+ diphosphatase